jgi:hypothetical protein
VELRIHLRLGKFSVSPFDQNLFWMMVSSELIGAIMSTKLEILMVGLLNFIIASLIQRKHPLWSAILLGMMINWKFQPVPLVGLIAIVTIIYEFNWKFVVATIGSTLLWYGAPLLVLSQSELQFYYLRQSQTLSAFIQRDWPQFEHVFKIFNVTLGNMSYSTALLISIVFGVLAALFLTTKVLKTIARQQKSDQDRVLFIGMATALGVTYILSFSPLSQSNAYVFYTPLLVFVFALRSSGGVKFGRAWPWAIGFTYFTISIAFSDLNPAPLRRLMDQFGLKPWGVVFFMIYFLLVISRELARTGRQPRA